MGKVALVTGASSGIGEEFARIHAEKGGDLVIVARNLEALKALQTELEEAHQIKVTCIAKDLSKNNAASELYQELKEAGIKVDYLINNAGFGDLGKFQESKLETNISMINLNVSALMALSHLYIQDFLQRKEGKILNVSSTASLMPGPLQAVYFATKAFVTSFSNALSEELKGTGITVTNLMPGATETGFAKVAGMQNTKLFKQSASARSVALDGYNAMIKGEMDVISGITSAQKVLMKLMPLMPKSMILQQVKDLQSEK